MTGTWIYSFPTFRCLHDRGWDAEAELENNRQRVEQILQDAKWYAEDREKTADLPNGLHQLLYVRYAGLTWNGNPYSVSAHPTHIALEIPVMTPGAEEITAAWEKWLGISADPVCTQSNGECMEETANAIRETIIEIYLELEQCSRRNCSRTQIKEHNRLMERLDDTVRTEIGDDLTLYEAVFLPLLEHETEYIRGEAASHCLHHDIAPERCVPILEEIRDTTDNIMLRADCGMSVWVYQNPQFRTASGKKQEENT